MRTIEIYERIKNNTATCEDYRNFHNCTVGKQFQPGYEVDEPLIPIIKSLNEKGLYTISCCSGHDKHSAHIVFATYVTKEAVEAFLMKYCIYSLCKVELIKQFEYSFVRVTIPRIFVSKALSTFDDLNKEE